MLLIIKYLIVPWITVYHTLLMLMYSVLIYSVSLTVLECFVQSVNILLVYGIWIINVYKVY